MSRKLVTTTAARKRVASALGCESRGVVIGWSIDHRERAWLDGL
jgi:hypothetical protein